MTAKKTPETFEKEFRAIWGERAVLLTPYTRCVDKVLVRFNECGHECWKSPNKLLAGHGCDHKECHYGLLSRNKTRSTEEFASDLASKGLRYELLSEFRGVKYPITVRNLSCGHTYTANAGNILNNGSGCPVCHGMKDTDMFVSLLNKKYGPAYTVLSDYVNNRTPVLARHKCGYEWNVVPKDLLRREVCPRCNRSYGEKRVEEVLTKLDVSFKPQYWFPDCRDKLPLPFDFAVFTDNGIKLIEFDGSQHYNVRKDAHWGSSDFEYILKHEDIKNVYCRQHGIPLLRIPYWKVNSVEKILREFLAITE